MDLSPITATVSSRPGTNFFGIEIVRKYQLYATTRLAVRKLPNAKTCCADAKFVREKTGYAIGGVCPIGHATPPVTLIDADLLALDSLWAAAGHPHAVFNLSPQELVALTGAPVADVALREPA